MKNSITYAAFGVAMLSISLAIFLISSSYQESSKIASLQQELDALKAQLATPNGRGTVAQQSISKMTNLGSMDNENSDNTDTNTRLENVEKQVSQLKSQIENLKP
ncbi:hypothetical protein [Candidatus Nitrosotenuis cloacae]|uniref:Uncharacterized protein n=1 Tax=Candidatus Nitrosotenuis cloacae TaxID=1603555 RepID=A0A3G1B7Z1_9ARCH|nr:hypothetical protein [Candidatus Nitrosotenuis cloacae]AJZ76238.1 hypothetical protein SU86_007530 [Candidatus Nitrosotenuis cloacae]